MQEDQDFEEDDGDELSAMAWESAIRGKSGREIAHLHQSWAAAFLARGSFNKAQVGDTMHRTAAGSKGLPSIHRLRETYVCNSRLLAFFCSCRRTHGLGTIHR